MSDSDPLAWLLASEGVPSAYAATRDGIDVMLRDRGLRRTSPETTAESLLRGAHASAVLDGSTSTLAQARAGQGDDVARGVARLYAELLGLAPTLRTAPLQAVARLHALAAGGSVPADALGRPAGPQGARRLRGIADLLVSPTRAPALLVAALVHAEVATARPFGTADAVVARGLERLVALARGADEKSLVVPEAGHLALRGAYESHLRGYAEGGRTGVLAWALYAAEAWSAGAEASPLRRTAE